MNTLFVILGPTGVGKTDLSLRLAQELQTPIISGDSRQIYRGLEIGTAAPAEKELKAVKHYFVGTHDVAEYFNASQFETEVMRILDEEIFPRTPNALLVGGSMMYIDAVCKCIDDIPNVDEEVRKSLHEQFLREGIDNIRMQLKMLDPAFYNEVDLKNSKRVIHAVEICLTAGVPYSSLRKNTVKNRPFRIVKIGLNRPREELYERINGRVDKMMAMGLEEEARRFYPQRDLNSLNTVGYKELFKYFDGEWTYDYAVNMIKQDSRRYARKQLSWFNRDKEIAWFHPDDETAIMKLILESKG